MLTAGGYNALRAAKRILDRMGLSPPQQEKPPPTLEVVRMLVDDDGRKIQAS